MSTQSLELTQDELGSGGLDLTGLAAMWEGCAEIRQFARQNRALLHWSNPSAVGVANLTLGYCTNLMVFVGFGASVVVPVARLWHLVSQEGRGGQPCCPSTCCRGLGGCLRL